ncbi:transporter substrate-binding domain-containing protein [Bartonella tamiae]|uniref:Solute-binding protein family 3/N-terminal domain-containing protein n=1 Tax=Bartonella tamiae Th239 TaxID=1094558 RepID=J0ZR22_9HYPH|nr:transporter substrate-binding domain-containing protein [Bartonella tamiae]EJF91133.1 hypothetical protein ME5_00465 [Bartonella tamiae Th239]EJF93202.1 hypothetical protein MEG_01416 [Bartonella tamiae Th307]
MSKIIHEVYQKMTNLTQHRRILLSIVMSFCFTANVFAQNALPYFFNPHERFEPPHHINLTRLRFLTTVDFEPFNIIDRTGRLSGYNIDLLSALCSELKLETICQIEALPWEELVPHLINGDGEAIIAGLNETPKNEASLLFTQTYLRFPARFIANHSIQNLKINKDNLRSLKIGLIGNTLHEKIFTAYFPHIEREIFDTEDDLQSALRNQEIDLAFGDGLSFSSWLNHSDAKNCCHFVGAPYIAPQILPQGMRIAVTKENPQLVQALNYALASLEKKGKLTELYLRYFPIGFYDIQSTTFVE